MYQEIITVGSVYLFFHDMYNIGSYVLFDSSLHVTDTGVLGGLIGGRFVPLIRLIKLE